MFIAIGVVLGSFLRIQITESIRISLAPAIVMMAGSILGPAWGAGVGFLTDFLSYIIANRAVGAYFPGYAVTMALYGILAGLLFYKRINGYLNITLSTIGIQTICSLLLNTMWTSVMYGTPFAVLLATRLPTTYISCVLYIVSLCFVVKNRDKIFRKIHQPA
jgi:ECF transporter S component (folate family)